ncbi:MAG: hypothetical protein IKD77_04290 [Bacilli bacterium]|nr:hypothetical protein [Bacilli bacterium]
MERELLKELYKYDKKMSDIRSKIFNHYNKLIFDTYELCDINTGAVYFYDYDTIYYKEKNELHPIFKIFDIDCTDEGRKYTCNLNDRILLRGPDNYYFGFSYLGDLKVKKDEVIECLEKVLVFADNAIKKLKKERLSYNDILDVKMVLALLDVIRNSTITNLFFFLMKENEIKDIYIYDNNDNFVCRLKALLYRIEEKIYDIIITQNDELIKNLLDIMKEFLNVQTDVVLELTKMKKLYNNDLYVRYRKSRESDNIIENIICLQFVFDKIVNNENKKNYENALLLGINYGSLELPIISEIILKNKKVSVKAGNIMKKFRVAYVSSVNKQKIMLNNRLKNIDKCILIDENFVTGNTLLYAKQYLKEIGIDCFHMISIQYPTLARYKI